MICQYGETIINIEMNISDKQGRNRWVSFDSRRIGLNKMKNI